MAAAMVAVEFLRLFGQIPPGLDRNGALTLAGFNR